MSSDTITGMSGTLASCRGMLSQGSFLRVAQASLDSWSGEARVSSDIRRALPSERTGTIGLARADFAWSLCETKLAVVVLSLS